MRQQNRELLELLKFELTFLEDGGYGRSTRTPWRPTRTFLDSPNCLNFDDPARPHPCSECMLMRFVPKEHQTENVPCWFIPVSANGETLDYYSRCGTQPELEEALGAWLRKKIHEIETEPENGQPVLTEEKRNMQDGRDLSYGSAQLRMDHSLQR